LVRQEIRSRCRGPKLSTIMRSHQHINGTTAAAAAAGLEMSAVSSSPDMALNLKISPSTTAMSDG